MKATYYLRNPKRMMKRDAVERCLDLELSYKRYEDVTILPYKVQQKPLRFLGGIQDHQGQFILSSGWDPVHSGAYDVDHSIEKAHVDKAIYIGVLYHVWGHCLMEDISRLWFLKTEEGRRLLEEGYRVVYCGLRNQTPPQHVRELFLLAGFDILDFVQITCVTSCSKIVIPDKSLIRKDDSYYYTKEFASIIHTIRDNVPEIPCDKIYFSRKGPKVAKDYGEDAIIALLEDKGFRIIEPTTLSVKEQIGLVKGCQVFAATEGSISHIAIFARPGTHHMLLRKEWRNLISYTGVVNHLADLDVAYIDANHTTHVKDLRQEYSGPFYLCVNRFLERYFHEKLPHTPRWLDPEWHQYFLQDPFAPERNIFKYLCPYLLKRIRKLINHKP